MHLGLKGGELEEWILNWDAVLEVHVKTRRRPPSCGYWLVSRRISMLNLNMRAYRELWFRLSDSAQF